MSQGIFQERFSQLDRFEKAQQSGRYVGQFIGVTFSAITFWKAATQGATSAALKQGSKEVVKKISCETGAIGAKVTKEGVFLNRGAESVNAGVNLNRKLTQLQNTQQAKARARTLPDGRIRYYEAERLSRSYGPTRGSSYVVEYNPTTGKVRGWNECYDHLGNINRVHPKNINGQELISPHYPPTGMELIR